jgi:predicted nucleic acid-binding protein
MKRWVVDCSFAGALFLPDRYSVRVQKFFSDLAKPYALLVPVLWWYELANVLTMAERKKLLNKTDVLQTIELFSKFPLETDGSFGISFMSKVHGLAVSYGLSAYDATYLELAMRLNASIATLDKELLTAAEKCNVEIVPLS